jgi:predicted RNase H-like HicB family nuclease
MNSNTSLKKLTFVVTKDEDGWHARAEGLSIFTEGDTLDELKANIKEAARVHLSDGEYSKYGFDSPTPSIRLVFKYEEQLAWV